MSRHLRLVGFAALLWIVSSLGCGSHRMVTDPVEHASRPGVAASLLAPIIADHDGANLPDPARGHSGSPPNVTITSPRPSALLIAQLAPHTTVSWTSDDPDGPGPGPKKYFYRIFSENDPEFPMDVALVFPDSLRRFYSPNYPGWTEVKGSVESTTLPDLVPNVRRLFVVTAVDRRGNEDPVFSLNRNMLMFNVIFVPQPADGAGADGAPQDRNEGGRVGGH